jgi:hypothetical protein
MRLFVQANSGGGKSWPLQLKSSKGRNYKRDIEGDVHGLFLGRTVRTPDERRIPTACRALR